MLEYTVKYSVLNAKTKHSIIFNELLRPNAQAGNVDHPLLGTSTVPMGRNFRPLSEQWCYFSGMTPRSILPVGWDATTKERMRRWVCALNVIDSVAILNLKLMDALRIDAWTGLNDRVTSSSGECLGEPQVSVMLMTGSQKPWRDRDAVLKRRTSMWLYRNI